jgi:tetratricopeptide (TPR) repeat protein
MPTKRRSRPGHHTTKKASSSAHAKRRAAARPARPSKPSKLARPPKKPARPTKPSKPAAPKKATAAATVGPSSRDQAVEKFERGFQALQQRQFGKAAELLRAVLNNYADEKELQERARVYLAICERKAGHDTKPRSFEDRLHAATVVVNRGAFDEALTLLRKLEDDGPANDYVQYLLSVVYAAVGNAEQALAHLRKAIELAPENLFRAAQDPDLESLRHDAGFAALAGELPRRRRPAGKRR